MIGHDEDHRVFLPSLSATIGRQGIAYRVIPLCYAKFRLQRFLQDGGDVVEKKLT